MWAKEKTEELEELNKRDAEKKLSSNGERYTQIQFLGQRFTDNGTYTYNVLTGTNLIASPQGQVNNSGILPNLSIIFDEDRNGNLLTTIKKVPLQSLRSRTYKIVGTGVEPAITNALSEPSTTLTTSPNNSNNTALKSSLSNY